ncbi:MAG: enolase [Clostridiales bacterium]|nr:enolase [Clostridiales bacterium]
MEFMGLTSVAVITVLCYLVAALIKTTPLNNKWLPAICGILGGILGIIGMNVMPYYPASDPLTALAVGVASGLAATGTNQVFKQLVSKSR